MRSAPTVQRGVSLNNAISASDDRRMIAAIAEDGSRYPVDKLEAHEKGLLHDAISVFVFDGEDMLIQRRASAKYHCPGLWANACCTHPDWGEDAGVSARRRLTEELGIQLDITEIGLTTYKAEVGNGLIEHERVRVFRGDADRHSLHFDLHPDEVSEVAWAKPGDLAEQARAHPERFAPWFRIYLDRWDQLGL